jgi:flagellar assembly protein FliH
MSMSFSAESTSVFSLPITALEYSDMAGHLISEAIGSQASGPRPSEAEIERPMGIEISEEELAERIKRERADATQQAELRLRQEYEAKLQVARASIATAIAGFGEQRTEYYARAEAEIVQLALSIAAKILHREAQVDPTLVAALVKMTLDKMHEGSSVTVRVGPGRAKRWKEYFAGQSNAGRVEVVEDSALSENDCLLETELGVANFGLDTQLKEIEKGFFDLLALRPESR